MGKKQKVKKKCCEKYLKSGKHCKSCPVLVKGEQGEKKNPKVDKKKNGKEKKNVSGKKKVKEPKEKKI